MNYIINNVTLILKNRVLKNSFLHIKDYRIVNYDRSEILEEYNKVYQLRVYDGLNLKVFPGFIDVHTHGGYGVDFETNDVEKYIQFATKLLQEGVTSFLFTAVTNPVYQMIKSIKYVDQFIENNHDKYNYTHAKCLGIHLEGPFISVAKAGAHKIAYIQKIDLKVLETLVNASKHIKMMTYDLNDDNDGKFINYLINHKIVPSVGHCNASIQKYYSNGQKYGINHATHLYNAMSLLENHRLGIAAAILTDDNVLCELICDEKHVDVELMKIAYKMKGYKKISLITDSIIAKGLPDGTYKLGELVVKKIDDMCYIENTNNLAGSSNQYIKCVQKFQSIFHLTDDKLSYLTSYNAAQQFNLAHLGQIKINNYADLVFLDKDYNVKATMVNGVMLYQNNVKIMDLK